MVTRGTQESQGIIISCARGKQGEVLSRAERTIMRERLSRKRDRGRESAAESHAPSPLFGSSNVERCFERTHLMISFFFSGSGWALAVDLLVNNKRTLDESWHIRTIRNLRVSMEIGESVELFRENVWITGAVKKYYLIP